MFGLGVTELLIIALILVFFFGAKRIPDIGRGIGGAIREFRDANKGSHGKERLDGPKPGEKKERRVSSSTADSMGESLMERVPEVKKVMDVKKKITKVREIIG